MKAEISIDVLEQLLSLTEQTDKAVYKKGVEALNAAKAKHEAEKFLPRKVFVYGFCRTVFEPKYKREANFVFELTGKPMEFDLLYSEEEKEWQLFYVNSCFYQSRYYITNEEAQEEAEKFMFYWWYQLIWLQFSETRDVFLDELSKNWKIKMDSFKFSINEEGSE